MIHSMTAFAQRERWGDWGMLSWELRSLNHRYLEVSARLPEEFRGLEARVRDLVGEFIGRGKVECNLRYQRSPEATAEVSINRALAERLIQAGREIQAQLDNPAPISAMDVLRWPGVLEVAEPDMGDAHDAALVLLAEALAELKDTRSREGAKLREAIEQRLEAMAVLVAQVRNRLPVVLENLRERLRNRLADLKAELDPSRLEQEIAIMAQRMDVDEELVRLETHIQEARRVLGRSEPVGRRLDFLMQELNREANTLGSKSADAEVTKVSIELKVLIEQMREQVQNIE